MAALPPVHLIIRLPYNRPETPVNDPPPIEWNADKENMLWEVIARSRAADSGGTDWQALSAHLQVPLPYLLYRAQVRYEEDLRGLQDIRGTLNGSNSLAARHSEGGRQDERPSSAPALPPRGISRMAASSIRRRTPISSHQRPVSQPILPNRLVKEQGSASTLTFSQRHGATPIQPPPRASSPTSSHSSMSSNEADKAEEEERRQEEQEAVGRRLKELEKMMSSDMLGFARPPRIRPTAGPSTAGPRSPLREAIQRGGSTSESTSTSPQGSIPSIPSPPPESQSQMSSQALSSPPASTTPASPPLLSPPRPPPQQRRGITVHALRSQRGSSHGSSASSFSDMSDAASVSASALESALLSNIRGGGSRLSMFARSHFGGGRGGH